jgi:hypothetical protein
MIWFFRATDSTDDGEFEDGEDDDDDEDEEEELNGFGREGKDILVSIKHLR